MNFHSMESRWFVLVDSNKSNVLKYHDAETGGPPLAALTDRELRYVTTSDNGECPVMGRNYLGSSGSMALPMYFTPGHIELRIERDWQTTELGTEKAINSMHTSVEVNRDQVLYVLNAAQDEFYTPPDGEPYVGTEYGLGGNAGYAQYDSLSGGIRISGAGIWSVSMESESNTDADAVKGYGYVYIYDLETNELVFTARYGITNGDVYVDVKQGLILVATVPRTYRITISQISGTSPRSQFDLVLNRITPL